MFNQTLSHEDCERIVADLGLCTSPFQCAHGRPTVIPIADIAEVNKA